MQETVYYNLISIVPSISFWQDRSRDSTGSLGELQLHSRALNTDTELNVLLLHVLQTETDVFVVFVVFQEGKSQYGVTRQLDKWKVG